MSASLTETLKGSDHCPVYADFRDKVAIEPDVHEHNQTHLLDIMNPPGTFRDGVRQKPWSSKDIPGFSGKLMAEFDKRRSIKDMFAKPSLRVSDSSTENNGTNDPWTNLSTASTEVPGHDSKRRSSQTSSQISSASPSKPQTTIKRGASDITAPMSIKKQKQNSSVAGADHGIKGQQSLKGFFVPKSKPESPSKSVRDRDETDLALKPAGQENEARDGDDLEKAIAASRAESKVGTYGKDTHDSEQEHPGTYTFS